MVDAPLPRSASPPPPRSASPSFSSVISSARSDTKQLKAGSRWRAAGAAVIFSSASQILLARMEHLKKLKTHDGTAKVLMSEGEALRLWQQGDEAMYEAEAVEARFSNRSDAQVTESLNQWWQISKYNERLQRRASYGTRQHAVELWGKAHHKYISDDAQAALMDSLQLDRKQYEAIFLRIFKALLDEDEVWDESEARELIDDAWEADAHGKANHITRTEFNDSLFECADMWTTSTDASEYATFLKALLHMICGGDPSGAWADFHSIGDGLMHKSAKGVDGTWLDIDEVGRLADRGRKRPSKKQMAARSRDARLRKACVHIQGRGRAKSAKDMLKKGLKGRSSAMIAARVLAGSQRLANLDTPLFALGGGAGEAQSFNSRGGQSSAGSGGRDRQGGGSFGRSPTSHPGSAGGAQGMGGQRAPSRQSSPGRSISPGRCISPGRSLPRVDLEYEGPRDHPFMSRPHSAAARVMERAGMADDAQGHRPHEQHASWSPPGSAPSGYAVLSAPRFPVPAHLPGAHLLLPPPRPPRPTSASAPKPIRPTLGAASRAMQRGGIDVWDTTEPRLVPPAAAAAWAAAVGSPQRSIPSAPSPVIVGRNHAAASPSKPPARAQPRSKPKGGMAFADKAFERSHSTSEPVLNLRVLQERHRRTLRTFQDGRHFGRAHPHSMSNVGPALATWHHP